MREARSLLRSAGSPLYRVVVAFSLIKEFLIIPFMGLIWKLTLMTTPEGFISNANIGNTLLKSPWIIVIGMVLLAFFLVFTMWQVSATVLGVAYAYEGKRPKILDLLKVSANSLLGGLKPNNVMLVLYTAIILPLTNVFQASDMIGSFVIPEYIQDFIDSKMSLWLLHGVVIIVATYFALRWFYVLPSFFFKNGDFSKASKESFALTQKGALKNGIKLVVYGFVETIRLAIAPFIAILILGSIVLCFVYNRPYAIELFNLSIVRLSAALIGKICGVMVYLSSMCYVINLYYNKCKENDSLGEIKLPELTCDTTHYKSGRKIWLRASIGCGLLMSCLYGLLVLDAGFNPEFIEHIIPKPAIIAHKGYSSQAPENTLDAFELADKTENANYIELDVWSSKDGIPVVIHNETIKAATGLNGAVYDYTFEELSHIQAPYAMDPQEFPDARIPSLEEVIAQYANTTPIVIEIKGYKVDNQLPAKIVALMEKYNCTDTSMIHSGDYAALKAVKECNSDIRCGLIQAIVTGNCYDLPYADFLSVEHSFVTNQMVDQLHRRGKEVFVWTVNRNEIVDSLLSLEVDGIITDYPDDIAYKAEAKVTPLDRFIDSINTQSLDADAAHAQFEAGEY